MSPVTRFTIEERADRFQRRYTGPWRTEDKLGIVTIRYRHRPRIEFVRLWVAGHDLWTHAIFRGVVVPALTPFVRWLDTIPVCVHCQKPGGPFEAELYGSGVDRDDGTVPVIQVQVNDRPLDQSYGDLQHRLAALSGGSVDEEAPQEP